MMYGTLLVKDWLGCLTDETLIALFNSSVENMGGNKPVKDGGIATATLIIYEMASRSKACKLNVDQVKDPAMRRKLLNEFSKALRSSLSGLPRRGGKPIESQDDIVSILGWEDIPESVLDPESINDELKRLELLKNPHTIPRKITEEEEALVKARVAEEIRRQQKAINTREVLGRESLNAYVAECLKSDEPTNTDT